MEKEQIASIALKMENKSDLLKLLNSMLHDDMEQLGEKFFPFTMKQINFYCNPNHTARRYRHFNIKKKSGGTRLITAPKTKAYKHILRYVNDILKSLYTPSQYATGFTQGRSVLNNAQVHIGQNYVLNIDLKDFFPSIAQPRVWKRLQLKPFNFPVPIASLIAGLCCMKEAVEKEDGSKTYRYVLPQGAPTSPIITNMICDTLDRRISGLAKRFGLNYTRYADDITFSSMHNVYQKDGEFWSELKRIIVDQGFVINEKKTRLQKRGFRQEVTGLVVNEKPNVTRRYTREIRDLLHIWQRYGYNDAYAKFYPKYKLEKPSKKGNPDLANVIGGKLMYLKMVKGEEDKVYQRLYSLYCSLIDNVGVVSSKGVKYYETMTVSSFEKKNKVNVVVKRTEPFTELVEDPKDSDKQIEIKHKAKWHSYFFDGDKKTPISVNRRIASDIDKEKLLISNCRDKEGNQFWLIHNQYGFEDMIHESNQVNVDELNNLLEKLINTT
jgi:retron-type reverse transcriptase